MNLGELKTSLTRFPPDMDEEAVLLHSKTQDGHDVTPLAIIAVSEMVEAHCVVLGTSTTEQALQHDSICMTLGQLKRGLSKLPPDMNTEEVMLTTKTTSGVNYEPLAFVGIPKDQTVVCIILGSAAVAVEMKKHRTGG